MHRYALLSLLPVVLGCANPKSDACASFMANNAATASPFCATFTQSKVTEASALPAWAAACNSKPSHVSKECSCYFTGGSAPTTTTTSQQTSAPVTTTLTTVMSAAPTSGGGGNACGSAAVDGLVGFGVGATGGGSGAGVTVTSCSELEAAIANGGVIKIQGILTGCDVLKVNGDTTIIGVGADSGKWPRDTRPS